MRCFCSPAIANGDSHDAAVPCLWCSHPKQDTKAEAMRGLHKKQRRSTIRAGTTASIATRCASITASTTSTIASASLFNTPLGAPQSVLLRHHENHGGDADGGCSALLPVTLFTVPHAREQAAPGSDADSSAFRFKEVNYSEHRVGAIRVMASSIALPNWQRQTNLWRK